MKFANFPIEVLLATREYLHDDIIQSTWVNDVVKNFIRRESEWSWRNFLSVVQLKIGNESENIA
jgi:hypothetical protein